MMIQIMCNQRDFDFLQKTRTMGLLNTACKRSALNTLLGASSFHLIMMDLAFEATGGLLALSSCHFQCKGWKTSGEDTSRQLMNRAEGLASCSLALSSGMGSRNLNSLAHFIS